MANTNQQRCRENAITMQAQAAQQAQLSREWRDVGHSAQAAAWQRASALDYRIARSLRDAATRLEFSNIDPYLQTK
jgi:hypothetical protein